MRILLPVLLLAASPAVAEVELRFYGGWAGAPDGGVTVTHEGAGDDRDVSLGGGAGQLGARATWWGDSGFGVSLDLSRFGGSDAEAGDGLSFGGLDTVTVSGMQRWEDAFGGVTPYVGAGLGLAMTEIDAEGLGGVDATGPAVSWVAGASVPIGGNWAVFGEYEGTYADVEGDTPGGGALESDTVRNSINLGVSFSF